MYEDKEDETKMQINTMLDKIMKVMEDAWERNGVIVDNTKDIILKPKNHKHNQCLIMRRLVDKMQRILQFCSK